MKARNIPYGYCYIDGKINCHLDESRIVREVFAEYLSGSSLLTIAQTLTERKTEYFPGTFKWNKARIKRIIDDIRYLGNEVFPQIVERETFRHAHEIKAERNTQKDIDRNADIFQMSIPLLCGDCGHTMRRIHDSRTSFREKWVCRKCGGAVKISDTELFKAITDGMNAVIANPQIICVQPKQTEPSIALCRAENEIGRLLDSPKADKETLKNKIMEYAALRYAELDTDERNAELLKAAFENTRPLSCYNRELAERAVRSITLYSDKSIMLTLINGQTTGKESIHGTDSSHAAEAGTHDRADHRAC